MLFVNVLLIFLVNILKVMTRYVTNIIITIVVIVIVIVIVIEVMSRYVTNIIIIIVVIVIVVPIRPSSPILIIIKGI